MICRRGGIYGIDPESGALTPINSPANSFLFDGFQGVVDPRGKFLYTVSSSSPGYIYEYVIDPATGLLTVGSRPVTVLSGDAWGVLVHPSGAYLYATVSANPGATVVNGYAIDGSSGVLTPLAGALPAFPVGHLVADSLGRFLFFIQGGASQIGAFRVDASTGLLNQIAEPPEPNPSGSSYAVALLAPGCNGGYLYGVAELANGYGGFLGGNLDTFSVDPQTGMLAQAAAAPYPNSVDTNWLISVACPNTTAPVSSVTPLPAVEYTTNFTVQWPGTDSSSTNIGYTIYSSDNGGPFTPWLMQTAATQATFVGAAGHTYGFYSIAQDAAGNTEHPKAAAETAAYVDANKPVSHVSLPSTETSPNFLVQWSETDAGGPGIGNYSIWVYDNGNLSIWLRNTTMTQAWYTGFIGHSYGFFSIAEDVDSNQELLKSAPDAATVTPKAPMAQDVNHDGLITCTDVDQVKASFGQKVAPPGSNPADVNKDGVVNVLDLAMVTRMLAPGTVCQ